VYVEPLRGGDVATVTNCRREDLRELEAILQLSPEAAAWSANSLSDTFEHCPAYFLVGWQGKEIAGFISGRRILDQAEILNLAVRPRSRYQGSGKALVKALLELFAREGAGQVFLEVRETNLGAVAFYERLGFQQIGRREAYYRDPVGAALILAVESKSPASTG